MTLLAVVASSKLYAEVAIKWLGYDEHMSVAMAYGDPVTTTYEHAIVVRPLSGMSPDERQWLVDELVPRVRGSIQPHPPTWSPVEEIPDPKAERIGTELEENPLYA